VLKFMWWCCNYACFAHGLTQTRIDVALTKQELCHIFLQGGAVMSHTFTPPHTSRNM
jgi:hypothetical protein